MTHNAVSDPHMLRKVSVVLVDTSHPGNIGAAARAMKTMGLSDLRLVRPVVFPAAEATARASGADDLLAGARRYESLAEAVADCACVISTSARSRSLRWPEVAPRDAARTLLAGAGQAHSAVVFGAERSGLSNADLELCQAMIRVPTAARFSSLNLAAAVQLVCYELRLASLDGDPLPVPQSEPAPTQQSLAQFYDALQRTLTELEYLDPDNPRLLMRRLRRLFNRAALSEAELNILRGILTAIGRKTRAAARD